MKLIQFNKDKYDITYNPELLTIDVFKKIIKRDKSKVKDKATKEISFIYFFTDLRSDYAYIVDDETRKENIKRDLKLPDDWDIDEVVQDAINLYKERSKTVAGTLYESACIAAIDISKHLKRTEELLEEMDKNNKPKYDISKITMSLQRVPGIMRNLRDAYTELVKEQEEAAGRKTGQREFNMFEDGI